MQEPRRRKIDSAVEKLEVLVALVAVVVLVVHLGGYDRDIGHAYLVGVDVAIIACFIFARMARLLVAQKKRAYVRSHRFEFASMAAVLGLLAFALALARSATGPEVARLLGARSIEAVALAIVRAYIVLATILRTVDIQRLVAGSSIRPAGTVVASYLVIIALGTALLSSPRAQAGPPVRFIDSLFTATSATCVTGLIVRDTGTDFSTFGQIVILALIQVGGLGLMTFTTFFAMVLGRGMGMRERLVMQDALNVEVLGRIGRVIVQVLLLTFVIEAIGAALLYRAWPDPSVEGAERLYFSVFHAVSAFCNAGFCLYPDSFERFADAPGFVMALALLIVLGGLGFAVLVNVGGLLRRRLRLPRTVRTVGRPGDHPPLQPRRLTLHSKVVLSTTAVLLVAGFVLLLSVESRGSWSAESFGQSALRAFFQSVTARTAGFSTANVGAMGHAAVFVLFMLMFIGASPGSTGGGVKTSTFAINVFAVVAAMRSRRNVEAFKRTIPPELVGRAFVIVMLAACVVAVSTLLLLISERGKNVMDLAFEAMSAFGTVGLSTGMTAGLSYTGKIVITVTILVGRIGPLTMMLALSSRLVTMVSYDYPTERLTIG